MIRINSVISAIIIIQLFINCSNKEKQHSSRDTSEYSEYTNYTLASPIKRSCSDVIFSDSLWLLWNRESYLYLEKKLKETDYPCLRRPYEQFKKGENFRLELAKVINRLRLLTTDDLSKEYYIVELSRSGSTQKSDSYIFSDNDGTFNSKYLRFSMEDTTWYLKDEFSVNKKDFLGFFNNVRKNDGKEKKSNLNVHYFNVSKFTKDSIECYLSYCGVCNECIDEFDKLVRY